jgi:hypothetical protein
MKKLIALLVAIAGLANLSANGQGFCTGLVIEEHFNNAFISGYDDATACDIDVVFVSCPVLSFTLAPNTSPTSPALTVAPVPETSSVALCAIGVAGLTVARRSCSFRRKA